MTVSSPLLENTARMPSSPPVPTDLPLQGEASVADPLIELDSNAPQAMESDAIRVLNRNSDEEYNNQREEGQHGEECFGQDNSPCAEKQEFITPECLLREAINQVDHNLGDQGPGLDISKVIGDFCLNLEMSHRQLKDKLSTMLSEVESKGAVNLKKFQVDVLKAKAYANRISEVASREAIKHDDTR